MKLLALDTATECCSAALLLGDELVTREAELERGHADRILPMIDELLAEAGVRLADLQAVAFGRGPGAFTGLRLAASVAQGLAFGAGIPVVPVSDLQALAQRAFDADPGVRRLLVCSDARMREVYWACFDVPHAAALARPQGAERVGPPAAVALPAGWTAPVHGAGRGLRLYPQLAARLGLAGVVDGLLPRAAEIARLAAAAHARGLAVAAEDAVPVYLRDDVAVPPPPR